MRKGSKDSSKYRKKTTPNKALPLEIFETGPVRQSGKWLLNPPAAYTGGRLSAAERRAGPVFWQLKRVRVYVNADLKL